MGLALTKDGEMKNLERDAMAAVIVAAITGKPNNEACLSIVQVEKKMASRDRAFLDDMRRG